MCVCVCFWTPVCWVWTHFGVVEFKTWTVTPLKPRICHLLLRIYTCPAPPSLIAAWCPSGGDSPLLPQQPLHRRPLCLHTGSSAYLGVTCLRTSIPMFPDSPLSFAVRAPSLRPSLPTSMPAGLLSPLHPCRCLNIFYREIQLILLCLLPPPCHPDYPPSLTTRLSVTNVKNRP